MSSACSDFSRRPRGPSRENAAPDFEEEPDFTGLRMRVGDTVVPVDPGGRFTATVRARGSIAIRQEQVGVLPCPNYPCYSALRADRLNLHALTLWLDGRRKAYEVSLPNPATFCICEEID